MINSLFLYPSPSFALILVLIFASFCSGLEPHDRNGWLIKGRLDHNKIRIPSQPYIAPNVTACYNFLPHVPVEFRCPPLSILNITSSKMLSANEGRCEMHTKSSTYGYYCSCDSLIVKLVTTESARVCSTPYQHPIQHYKMKRKIMVPPSVISYQNNEYYFGQLNDLPLLSLQSNQMVHDNKYSCSTFDIVMISLFGVAVLIKIIYSFYSYYGSTFRRFKKDTGVKDPEAFKVFSKKRLIMLLIIDSCVGSIGSVIMFFYFVKGCNGLTIVDPISRNVIKTCPSGYYSLNDDCYAFGSGLSLCGKYPCYSNGVCYQSIEGSCTLKIPDSDAVSNSMCQCINGDQQFLTCSSPCGYVLNFGNRTRYSINLNKGLSGIGSKALMVVIGNITKRTRNTCKGGSSDPEDTCDERKWSEIIQGHYSECKGYNCDLPYQDHACFPVTGHKMCEAIYYPVESISEVIVMSKVTAYEQPVTIKMSPPDSSILSSISVTSHQYDTLSTFHNGIVIKDSRTFYTVMPNGGLGSQRAFLVYQNEPSYTGFQWMMTNSLFGSRLWEYSQDMYNKCRDRLVAHYPLNFRKDEYIQAGLFKVSMEALLTVTSGLECNVESSITGMDSCHYEETDVTVVETQVWAKYTTSSTQNSSYLLINPYEQFISPVSKVAYAPGTWTTIDAQDACFIYVDYQSDSTPKPEPTASPTTSHCTHGQCGSEEGKCHATIDYTRGPNCDMLDINRMIKNGCADEYFPPITPDSKPEDSYTDNNTWVDQIKHYLSTIAGKILIVIAAACIILFLILIFLKLCKKTTKTVVE